MTALECAFAERIECLERERDEAREERDKLQVMRKEVVAANKGAKINAQVSNSLAGKLNQAERERDEAREKAERYRLEANAMMLQRDEARAIAYDLATIASHCLGWHDHETGDAAERIASVLRRWKDAK